LLQLEEVYRRIFWFQEVCEQRVTQDIHDLTGIAKEIAKIMAGGGSAAVQIAGSNVAEVRRNREHITNVAGMVRQAAMQSNVQRGYDEWANGNM
jgi:hypothetical protein